jgi:Flp pilus assembly protein TadD
MSAFWHTNLAALKRHHPKLFHRVAAHAYKPVGEITPTPTGLANLCFSMPGEPGLPAYDGQDPWQDAAVHLQTVEPGSRGLALFVGLGLGYGPLRVLQERPTLGMMVILEPCFDLFVTSLQHVDLRPLLAEAKVRWLLGDIDFGVFEEIVARIAALEDTHILRHVRSFQWREDIYAPLNHQAFQMVNQLNASGGTTRKAGEHFLKNRLANMTLLRHSADLGEVKDLFLNTPAVLVAAGPSLDQSLQTLQKVAGRCVLFAVDSALAPLLQAGIMPDFVTALDFQAPNFEKLAPFIGTTWPFSLICIPKVTPLIPKRLRTQHLFWTFSEDVPQQWMINTLGIKELTPAGFSVAHLSLAGALLMGCDPIIFVGQDLGYTTGGADHAAGTVIMGHGLPTDREIFYVPGIDGNQIATDRALMSLQKKFEDIIAANPGRSYFNATVAGAHITGTEPVSLDRIAARFMPQPIPVQESVAARLAPQPSLPAATFVKECRNIASSLAKMQGQINQVVNMAAAARGDISRLQKQRTCILSFAALPPVLAKKLAKFDRLNHALDECTYINEQFLELTYPCLSENDRLREANEQIKERDGYLAWLLAEIARIDMVHQERHKALTLYRQALTKLLRHLEREEHLLQKITEQPGAENYLALARLYCHSDDYALAEEAIHQALLQGGHTAEAYVLDGEIKAALQDFDQADESWRRAISASPQVIGEVTAARQRIADAWTSMAEVHGSPGEEGGRFPQLLPIWLGRVAAVVPLDQEFPPKLSHLWQEHAAYVEQCLAAGATEQADSVLGGWAAFDGRLPELRALRAHCAAAKGDAVTAVKEMETALHMETSAKPAWLAFLARRLLEVGRFDEGIARLQEAVVLDPNTAVLWEELGDALATAGDEVGAVMAFERCYLALPNRLDVLLKMGDSYLRNHQAAAATAAYEAVLFKEPQSEAARSRLDRVRHLVDLTSDVFDA